jgi:branched-chain amino acid transport system substrate-binding protein
MSKRLSAVLAGLLVASVAAVGAFAAGRVSTLAPGITAKTIKLGGTYPFSGPASSYAPIPKGLQVYFSYINARRGADKKRGVGGRQIIWKTVDDGYNPANTVQQTRGLVESDKVFALVGGLGTEPQQAVVDYLNQSKVPQLFVSTGATEFDRNYQSKPWTIGWQPDYEAEGAVYGKYIVKNQPNAKIGIIFQNDSFGQDYIAGLKEGLGAKASNITIQQGFDVTATSVAAQVAAIKAANPDILCIFATPTPTVRTYATMKALAFKPDTVYVNSVSATDTFMGLAVANSSADTVNGSISTSYVKDPANPKYDNDPAMKQYKALMAKYGPGLNANNGLYIYGFAKAYDTVQLLQRAGKNPTRAKLMQLARNMNWVNPFLLPGVRVTTKGSDQYPISQLKLIKFNNGLWNEQGDLLDGRGGA